MCDGRRVCFNKSWVYIVIYSHLAAARETNMCCMSVYIGIYKKAIINCEMSADMQVI